MPITEYESTKARQATLDKLEVELPVISLCEWEQLGIIRWSIYVNGYFLTDGYNLEGSITRCVHLLSGLQTYYASKRDTEMAQTQRPTQRRTVGPTVSDNGAQPSPSQRKIAQPTRQRITDLAEAKTYQGRMLNQHIQEMFSDRDFCIVWLSGKVEEFTPVGKNSIRYMEGLIYDPQAFLGDDDQPELLEVSFSGRRVLSILEDLSNGIEWNDEEGILAKLVWVQLNRQMGTWELQ